MLCPGGSRAASTRFLIRSRCSYADNYLIDLKAAVILDVEATRAIRQAEVGAARTMIERTAHRFDLMPERLAADSAYGSRLELRSIKVTLRVLGSRKFLGMKKWDRDSKGYTRVSRWFSRSFMFQAHLTARPVPHWPVHIPVPLPI